MRANLALRQSIDAPPHGIARVGATRPLMNATRGNAELDTQSERSAREGREPAAEPVVPRNHVPDLKQEQARTQLSFWPNLMKNRELPVFIRNVEHNPDPVTEYIRFRLNLAHKEDERGAVQSIERRSGLGPGHVFKIKNDERARVTSRTAQALAVVFGWPDYGDFLAEVVKWWKEEGQQRIGAWAFPDFPEIHKDSELRVAIDMAKGGGGTVPEIIADTLKTYRAQIGTGEHDSYWWVTRFGESAKKWRAKEAARVAEKKTQKKAARELARSRKEAPESSHQVAGEIPPSSESEPKLRVRKR